MVYVNVYTAKKKLYPMRILTPDKMESPLSKNYKKAGHTNNKPRKAPKGGRKANCLRTSGLEEQYRGESSGLP